MIGDKLVISEVEGHIKVENNTPFDLWIGIRPIPPKRKVHFKTVVPSKQFMIWDDPFRTIDWKNIYFKFMKPQGKTDA